MNKTDRDDSFSGLARLVRLGWHHPVAVRLMKRHRLRALLFDWNQLVGMTRLSTDLRLGKTSEF
jgi:hypothetical protein